MGDVNWALGLQQGPDAGQAFAQAFEKGLQHKKEMRAEEALRALAAKPDDPAAIAAYTQTDPRGGMQYQQQHQQNIRQKLEQHREDIVKGAQIFRQMGVRDEASYQAARQTAQQMGIDVSQAPPNFDERYVAGVVKLADTFAPQKGDDGRIVITPPGGQASIYQGGQLRPLVVPNPGNQVAGAPVQQGGMPNVSDQASYDAVPPGAQYTTPDGHVRVKQGGPAPQAPGMFPAPGY